MRSAARRTASALALVASLVGSRAFADATSLNQDWGFHLGDAPGAEAAGFDDAGWRRVSVPHDWSIEDRPGQNHPFAKDALGKDATGWTVGGVGWYRKTIDLPADVAAKTVLLRFEAVYMDAEIFVNGEKLARHPNGYTAFDVDISGKVRPGRNTVAIRVNNEEPSSRWYSGSGVIRPVRLEILDRTHIDPWGPAITTPAASRGQAQVQARTVVHNARPEAVDVELVTIALDPAGREVRRVSTRSQAPPSADVAIEQALPLSRPALWSLETPNLYTLVQEVRIAGATVDARRTRFGVRTISFDADHGFLLNGKRVLLQGGNMHHDNYMLGGAGLPRADRRKVELMKSAGFNAIRSAHNPASQATLEAADELGMLVIDEAFDQWSQSKKKNDYARFFPENWRSDLAGMVAAGRNHPSLIMWSIGNEIPESTRPIGGKEAKELADHVRSLDPSRPVTASAHVFAGTVSDFIAPLDVAGYNYYFERYGPDHLEHPRRVMYGSESFSRVAFDTWRPTYTMPWVIGDFVWAAVDYLGEAGVGWGTGEYPFHLAFSGEIDATGKLLPAAYYRRVLWKTGLTPTSAFIEWPNPEGPYPDGEKRIGKDKPWRLETLVQSWSGLPPFVPLKLVVFSEDEEVEVLVNGVSLGRKPVSQATGYRNEFWVRYAPGELKVVGYLKGKPHSEWVMRTAGAPAAVKLTLDRARLKADGDDLVYVTAQLVDAKGEPVTRPKDDKRLTFKVAGAGRLAGVGNGDPVALESFQSGERSTFWGRAVAVVRASQVAGPIRIDVSADGLPPASATLQSGD